MTSTPMATGEATGIFSIAFRDERHGVIVGGTYTKEHDAVNNLAISADGVPGLELSNLGRRPSVEAVCGISNGLYVPAWIPIDRDVAAFAVGFGCPVTGTANYTIEYTFDDIFNPAVVSPTVFPHPIVAAQTTNQPGNFAFPISAMRLTVNSGSGSVALTVHQGNAP